MLKEPNSQIIKLADFGLSKMFDATVRMNSTVGSPGYVAPEVLFDDNYGEPVDMWSVGVITYILLSGVPPFYDKASEMFRQFFTIESVTVMTLTLLNFSENRTLRIYSRKL